MLGRARPCCNGSPYSDTPRCTLCKLSQQPKRGALERGVAAELTGVGARPAPGVEQRGHEELARVRLVVLRAEVERELGDGAALAAGLTPHEAAQQPARARRQQRARLLRAGCRMLRWLAASTLNYVSIYLQEHTFFLEKMYVFSNVKLLLQHFVSVQARCVTCCGCVPSLPSQSQHPLNKPA